jgi:hypothetical protein
VKVGDLVAIKSEWQTLGVYYSPGVITIVEEGLLASGPWKNFRVQWIHDFLWHEEEQLELISESR